MTGWTRRRLLLGAIVLATPLLSACSSVGTFDALFSSDEDVSLAARDIAFGPDPRQKLDVYVPNDGKRSRPSILFIYGGSWSNGDRGDYGFAARAIAARGFTVVVADYRLVPAVRYPDFVVDGAAALRWMQENMARYGGDPSRIAVVGHSAGAYNAVMLGLDPALRRAGGYTGRLRGVVGLAGPYDFLPLDDRATIAAFGAASPLDQTQPVNRVTRSAPPMLLAAGDADTTVKPRNTVALAARLRAAGVPVEEKIYPGIGHAGIVTALARAFRDRAPVLEDTVSFLRRVTAS